MKRIIAVFTGNRAEYGLLKPILRALKEHPETEYRLIASGAHLDPNFGKTIDQIRNDGFEVHAVPRIELVDDEITSTPLAIGSGIIEMVKVLRELSPDILVVYADRFEGFAAVIAASQMRIPVAHVEGGDLTEGGALDDSVRHAMTKLSHLHFATNEDAKRRILALGEESWRVHNMGLPAIDTILEGSYATPEEISAKFNLDLRSPVIVYTQHSIATEFESAVAQVKPSLMALQRLAVEGIQVIITYPNNDLGGRKIIQELEALAKTVPKNIQIKPTLGAHFYYGILSLPSKGYRALCMGNSSSGIKETPAFGCPCLNIGNRQLGRLTGNNVKDCGYDADEIYQKARTSLDDARYFEHVRATTNPYGKGNSGRRTVEVLATVPIDAKLIQKKMTI